MYLGFLREGVSIMTLCAVLLALFLVDFAYSSFVPNTGEGITDYPAPSLPPAQE